MHTIEKPLSLGYTKGRGFFKELVYMIKIVISPEYFGNNDSDSSIREQMKELGAYDINIDEGSGFVTAVMTMESYERLIDEIKNRVENTALNIEEKYNNVIKVECNGDYTAFNVTAASLSGEERASIVFELLMSAATYQVISGIPQSEVSVRVSFYDREGMIIEVVDTSEV